MDILAHILAQSEGIHLARARFSDVANRIGVTDTELIQTLEPTLRDTLLAYPGPVHLTVWRGPLGEGTLFIAWDGTIQVRSENGAHRDFATAASFVEAGYESVNK